MYLLCGYYPSFSDTPPVKILGISETLEEAKHIQETECGCLSKINKCWKGKNGIITWVLEAKLGTLKKAIDIRDTHNAL